MSSPLTIWQIQDEKPGHRNQLRGLTQALGELATVECHEISAPPRSRCLAWWWAKRFPPGESLPRPDLILGAGHATHFALLAAQHAYGGKTVVLMKPSLPPALFDLCLVPEHDQIAEKPNVVRTRGALNTVRPSTSHDAQRGLLLIGGPSKSHGWSEEQMLAQIRTIAHATPNVQWTLTNSRRTPHDFLGKLNSEGLTNLRTIGYEETAPDWLPQQLCEASQVWVSEDSVSMVYESLTSGAAVGILQVPCPRPGRVSQGVKKLCEQRWVTRLHDWKPGDALPPPPEKLQEASRCAQLILHRFGCSAAA